MTLPIFFDEYIVINDNVNPITQEEYYRKVFVNFEYLFYSVFHAF